MSNDTILKNEDARAVLNELTKTPKLERGKYGEPYVCGYYKDNSSNLFVAFDNRTGDCWVEEFTTENQCLKFLN